MQAKSFIKNYEVASQGVLWLFMWFSVVALKDGQLQGIAWSVTILSELVVGS